MQKGVSRVKEVVRFKRNLFNNAIGVSSDDIKNNTFVGIKSSVDELATRLHLATKIASEKMSCHHETIPPNPPPNFDENSLDRMNNTVTRLPNIKNSSCDKMKIAECMASTPESSDETEYNITTVSGEEVAFGTSKNIFRNSGASEMSTKNLSVEPSKFYETTVSPKSLNPSSDSGDYPVFGISNSVTIEIPEKLSSSIPQFEYDNNRTTYPMTSNDSSDEGNSDVTVVIGDNISVYTTSVSNASQIENSRPMVMHLLNNDFDSFSSNPRRNEEKNYVVPTSDIINNFYPQQTSLSNLIEDSEIDWNYIRNMLNNDIGVSSDDIKNNTFVGSKFSVDELYHLATKITSEEMSHHHEIIPPSPPLDSDENILDSMNNVVTRLLDNINSSCDTVKIMECMASIPMSSDETDYNSTITIGDEVSFGTSKNIFRNSTVILTSDSIFRDGASEMPTNNSSVESYESGKSYENETTVLQKSSNPSSDSGDCPVVGVSNSTTIEIPAELPSSVTQIDFDDSCTNSDVTTVIGDDIPVDSSSMSIDGQTENFKAIVRKMLNCDFESLSSNPGSNEESNYVVLTSDINNDFIFLYPQQTSLSNDIGAYPRETDRNYSRRNIHEIEDVTIRFVRRDFREAIFYILSLLFLLGLFVYVALNHPDSAVVCIVFVAYFAVVIGLIIGLIPCLFKG